MLNTWEGAAKFLGSVYSKNGPPLEIASIAGEVLTQADVKSMSR